ncbi:hypothetical protein FHS27_001683 [Rhodopirellula rubra]|uniref:Uncharacterized protein n=1 Tax=Aporhodopirellula rubra TaxID=980271 RepID=A0A7W5DX84_9BACT|nr:hypothetical protein [Aporhodopirellula rubra]
MSVLNVSFDTGFDRRHGIDLRRQWYRRISITSQRFRRQLRFCRHAEQPACVETEGGFTTANETNALDNDARRNNKQRRGERRQGELNHDGLSNLTLVLDQRTGPFKDDVWEV